MRYDLLVKSMLTSLETTDLSKWQKQSCLQSQAKYRLKSVENQNNLNPKLGKLNFSMKVKQTETKVFLHLFLWSQQFEMSLCSFVYTTVFLVQLRQISHWQLSCGWEWSVCSQNRAGPVQPQANPQCVLL